ncbi:hypothetical protein ES702_01535 [subsurface metagenome]
MDQQSLAEIRGHFHAKLQPIQAEVIRSAVAMLQEDIQNPKLTSPDAGPDTFMLRAHQVGVVLFQNKFFAVAETLYRILAKETEDYRKKSHNWRHAGALYANTAAACAAQGNLDQAVIELLRAAHDDERTYGVAKHRSFAITNLLQEHFGNPVRCEAWAMVRTINQTLTLANVESLCEFLGDLKYGFLAYVHLASRHVKVNQQFPNEFSQLQIFSALRSLSCLLEVELKTIANNIKPMLFDTMKALYKKKGWWQSFDNTRTAIGATRNSNVPVDDQLRDAIAINPTDDDASFWKSLLIAYIVRNYTTHQMETQCALVRSYSQEVLGHTLHVMITARRHT